MEREPSESENTSQETGDETERFGDEGSSTVMPEENAEDQPRAPEEPPPGSGPEGG